MENAGNAAPLAFILTVAGFFLGCMAGTRELVMERRLFWRETGMGLSIPAFLGAKLFVLMVLTFVQVGALTALVLKAIDVECDLTGMVTASLSVSLAGLAAGLLISAASPNEAVATKLMVPVILVQMIMSGLFKLPTIVQWGSKVLVTCHYGFGSMLKLFQADAIQKSPALANKVQYDYTTVVVAAVLQSIVMLGVTIYFLKRTAQGEDPARGE